MALTSVPIAPLPPDRFRELIGERYREVEEGIVRAREVFAGRAVWHVNSTARGGGVVELLQSLLAYARGAGVDARWAVIDGEPGFYRITKRIHNHLHGFPGDGGQLGDAERRIYEATLQRNADCFRRGNARLDVEGNADERGPEAYNRDLGERRAHAVSSYLQSLGVSASDLNAISFGKDRPLCLGHEESCWKQNRRVTLRPSNLSASTPRTVE